MVFLAIVFFWCAYLVRGVLLLVYCAMLLAIGFSPIVRLIERQTLLPIGSARFPRWLAILVLVASGVLLFRYDVLGSYSRHAPDVGGGTTGSGRSARPVPGTATRGR